MNKLKIISANDARELSAFYAKSNEVDAMGKIVKSDNSVILNKELFVIENYIRSAVRNGGSAIGLKKTEFDWSEFDALDIYSDKYKIVDHLKKLGYDVTYISKGDEDDFTGLIVQWGELEDLDNNNGDK